MNTSNINMNKEFSFVKADKELFAVYQTIYSNTDIELWYDWKTRLKDTMWSDDCYFVLNRGEKIGGAILSNGNIAFPFIIPPFCDRVELFKQLHKKVCEITTTGTINTTGMLPTDVYILLSMGYRIVRTRMAMIRPTDVFDEALGEYTIKVTTLEDAEDVSKVFFDAYSGGMDYEVFGTPTLKECTDDAIETINRYIASESIEQSCIIYDKDKPVAACLVGCDSAVPNGFTGISDIGVHPDYRGRGLAEHMIKRALTIAKQKNNSQAMRLFVTVGNPAESLYNKLGFMPGPRFSPMIFTIKK